MSDFYGSFQKVLGKPAVQMALAAATLLLGGAAAFLDMVSHTAGIGTSCMAAVLLLALCASIWFRRALGRREKAGEAKRREEARARAEMDKKKLETDAMGEYTLKVLRFFFYHEYDLSIEDIKLGFKLDDNAAQVHLDELENQKFIRQTTISGIGSDAACYTLTEAGRAHAVKNMFD